MDLLGTTHALQLRMRNFANWAVLLVYIFGFQAQAAQNSLTMAYAKKNVSPFKADVSYHHRSYFDENVNSAMDIEAGASYALNYKYSLGVNFEYIRPYSKYSDDKTSGVEDVLLYWQDKIKFENGYSMGIRIRGILPTSTTSQTAGMQGGTSGEISLTKLFSGGRVFIGTEIIRYYYQFYTANAAGTEVNAPWAIWNKLGFDLKIYGPVTWENDISFYTYRDYADFTDTVFRMGTGFSYQVARAFSLDLSFRRTDKIITNNSLFDRYNTAFYAGFKLFI